MATVGRGDRGEKVKRGRRRRDRRRGADRGEEHPGSGEEKESRSCERVALQYDLAIWR